MTRAMVWTLFALLGIAFTIGILLGVVGCFAWLYIGLWLDECSRGQWFTGENPKGTVVSPWEWRRNMRRARRGGRLDLWVLNGGHPSLFTKRFWLYRHWRQ